MLIRINSKKECSRYFVDVVYGRLADNDLSFACSNIVSYFLHKPVCRYCKEPLAYEDAVVTQSYWGNYYYLAHSYCKKHGESEERYLCQSIDADCNDCFYFKRESQNKGICTLKNTSTASQGCFCSGNSCFVHRLDGV